MTPIELLNGLRRLGVRVTLNADTLHVSAPAGVINAEMRQRMVENKSALVDLLRTESAEAESSRPVVPLDQIAKIVDKLDATFIGVQKRRWLPEREPVVPVQSVVAELRRVLPELKQRGWPRDAWYRLTQVVQPGDQIVKVTDDYVLVSAKPPRCCYRAWRTDAWTPERLWRKANRSVDWNYRRR